MSPESNAERSLATLIDWEGLARPEREVTFYPSRKWRFDFAWPAHKLAVEVEGGSWVNGAHTRGSHFESDAEKYNAAAELGWTVLRYTPRMIDSGQALYQIRRIIEARKAAA
jgi:very-short-patch-repair endonuclease